MTASPTPSIELLRAVAGSVSDPELPFLSLDDLGIVRSIVRRGETVVVRLTPTYSGCPAIEVIERDVEQALTAVGCRDVEVERSLAPAWTTDWITDEGRNKLAEAGIVPPLSADDEQVSVTVRSRDARTLACPLCGSTDTERISIFGSTACKSLHCCRSCGEPFDHFKAL